MHHVSRRGVPLVISVLILVGALIICYVIFNIFSSYLQGKKPALEFPNQHLKVHKVVEYLSSPTSMAFIDNNKLLVLERSGSVRLISDGILHDQPVLTVPVDTDRERGLLGITTVSDSTLGNRQRILLKDRRSIPENKNLTTYSSILPKLRKVNRWGIEFMDMNGMGKILPTQF